MAYKQKHRQTRRLDCGRAWPAVAGVGADVRCWVADAAGGGESQAAAVGVYCEMRTRRVADELGHSVMNNTQSIAVSVASP